MPTGLLWSEYHGLSSRLHQSGRVNRFVADKDAVSEGRSKDPRRCPIDRSIEMAHDWSWKECRHCLGASRHRVVRRANFNSMLLLDVGAEINWSVQVKWIK